MTTVVVLNSVKTVCYLFVITKEGFAPLVTLGDALKSFLISPDKHTKRRGPLSADDVRASDNFARTFRSRILALQTTSQARQEPKRYYRTLNQFNTIQMLLPLTQLTWRQRKRRWFSGTGTLRWILTYVMQGLIFSRS